LLLLLRDRERERERDTGRDRERERERERYRLKDSEKRERERERGRERERAREQERERERDPDDGAMELRSAATHFFFSHKLQIISPRDSVKSCKNLPTQMHSLTSGFKPRLRFILSRDCGRAAGGK
jgi:hypothetical protein